jgi:hypothetical protein
MKRYLLALTASVALAAGAATAAKAVELDVGPGGVRVGPGYHDRYYRDRDAYAYRREGCRVVIDHHTNRYGEDVTVRRRICD